MRLDLDRDDPVVAEFDDKVDLVFSIAVAEMIQPPTAAELQLGANLGDHESVDQASEHIGIGHDVVYVEAERAGDEAGIDHPPASAAPPPTRHIIRQIRSTGMRDCERDDLRARP
jgi:hypothetical protein